MTAYTFPAGAPTVADVANAMRTAFTEEVMLSGSLLRPPLTEEQTKSLAEQKTSTVLLSDAEVTMWLPADRKLRRRRAVSITVSLRGSEFVVIGDTAKLFGAMCEVLEALCGITLPRPHRAADAVRCG